MTSADTRRNTVIKRNMKNEAFAARWPEVCKLLGNFPPTFWELQKIKLLGPPEGFNYLPPEGQRYGWGTRGRATAPRSW
jgi:hypothetical protein